jgi:KaiC/GvpD/RAD55 family RecA-like ATPase
LDEAIEGGFPKAGLFLVAGSPGSGKTAFSAKFLYEGILHGDRGIYVSFAEGHDAFFNETARGGLDFAKAEEDGKFLYMDLLTVKNEGLPAVTQSIVDAVLDFKAARLVIDSFSAMAQAVPQLIEARSILHTILGKVIRQAECTTLLISEVPVGTTRLGLGIEEFVADGVLKFIQKEIDGRIIRNLSIHKMRGTKIGRREHVFTLDGGFRVLSPFDPSLANNGHTYPVIKNSASHSSTGIKDLDIILGGGLKRGSHILLEVGEDISSTSLIAILTPIISNTVRSGDQIICVPVNGMYPEELQETLRKSVPEGLGSVQIFDITGKGGPNTVDLGGATVLQPFDMFWKTAKKMRKPENRLISIIGFDALEARYAKDLAAMQGLIIETVAKVRNAGDIMISIARPFSNTLRELASASDVHLRLAQYDGVLCLLGVKPRTDYYGVSLPDTIHAQIGLVQVS